MTVHPLQNDRWSFASNCFVCEPSNELGLRVPFFHDDQAACVFATYTLDEHYSGAPSYVHGGLTLAVLDEAMSWATIALAARFAVTAETTARFDWPIRVGREYRVEARLVTGDDCRMTTAACVLDPKGRPCVTATADMVVLSAANAHDAVGSAIAASETGYVR
jgi:acyl-coenzyme A thioesterase PaaI-like protein